MKTGDYEKFSNLCGIAKVEHENEIFFVAYADYMDFGEHGTIVGRGKTEIEALRSALINMSKNIAKLSNEIHEFNENLRQLSICDNPLDFDHDPIWAIEGDERIEDLEGNIKFIPSGKFHNADLLVDSDGKAWLGLH